MSHHMVSNNSNRLLLDQCEAIIEEGLKTLEKVERALAIVEQMKLYKDDFESLDSYYKERWVEKINLSKLCTIQSKK